jgi:hypothetical protein
VNSPGGRNKPDRAQARNGLYGTTLEFAGNANPALSSGGLIPAYSGLIKSMAEQEKKTKEMFTLFSKKRNPQTA